MNIYDLSSYNIQLVEDNTISTHFICLSFQNRGLPLIFASPVFLTSGAVPKIILNLLLDMSHFLPNLAVARKPIKIKVFVSRMTVK